MIRFVICMVIPVLVAAQADAIVKLAADPADEQVKVVVIKSGDECSADKAARVIVDKRATAACCAKASCAATCKPNDADCKKIQRVIKCAPGAGDAAQAVCIVTCEAGDSGAAKSICVGPRGVAAAGAAVPKVLCEKLAGPQAYYYAVGAAPNVAVQAMDEAKPVQVMEFPPIWIGVRCTPIPEALAAHVSGDGVMIDNIVVDSPADDAGLERYDIIRSFGGSAINSTEDLLEAISAAGAETTKIGVVRGGDERVLRLTPTKRKQGFVPQWKYEEADVPFIEESMDIRGLKLDRDAQGNWLLKELGELEELPEMLKDLDVELKVIRPQVFKHMVPDAQHGMMWFGNDGEHNFRFGRGAEDDASVVISIVVSDDDGALSIKRDADGSVTVERTDEDGNEVRKVYDDVEEFKKDDPETYERYREYSGYGATEWIFTQPGAGALPGLRKQFDVHLRKQFDDAHKQFDDATRQFNDATNRLKDARKIIIDTKAKALDSQEVQEQIEKAVREAQRSARRGVDTDVRTERATKSVRIIKNEDGSIELTIEEGGKKVTYEFASEADFKADEPSLYKTYMTRE